MRALYEELRQALRENRSERGAELCRELLSAQPDDAELLSVAGALAHGRGELEEALEAFSRAAALDPTRAECHNNVGVVLEALKRPEEAAASYREALARREAYPDACCNLGNALSALGREDEALACYRRALSIDPGHADARYNMGNLLRKGGEWREAAACYRTLLASHPGHLSGWINLGGALHALNDLPGAVEAQRRALELDPRSVDAHWNLALALLASGDYRQGWREYEWRLKDPAARFQETLAGKGVWDGSPLCGRRLLLRAEQGFGDAIQFYRYAQLLAGRGDSVLLECRRELLPLLSAQGGEIALFPAGEDPPPFDTFAYLLSLPHLLGADGIPGYQPPLRAEPGPARSWRERVGRGEPLKAGVVWAGSAGYRNDRYRSLAAAELAPLSRIPGLGLYSLQLGASEEELSALGLGVTDLAPGLASFADTAAAIENLDLVVAVDTAVAHLAGAMGKPVLVLLPFSCDWRWLSGRADSPWYPSMRLYRQPRPGDWGSVVAAVASDLSAPGGGEEPNSVFREANRLRGEGDPAGAVFLYLRLLSRLPDCAEIHNNLGLAQQDQGDPEGAKQSYRRALELKPGLADAHNNLGALLVSRGRHEEAEPCFRRALELNAAYLPAYVNLGSCLQVLERPEEAVELYRRAIGLDPGCLEARINLGTAYQDLMRPELAIETYRELLRIAPEHPEGHWNLALSLLSVGEFERGWREYQWRLVDTPDRYAPPRWEGEPLEGRTILLVCEQGLGDTLQFVRYAPLVAKRGGRVLLECQIPSLKPLLSRVPGVAAVFSRGEELPRFDCQARLLSLPHLFGTTLDNMPDCFPYLAAEPRRAELWRRKLAAGAPFKVGLVWRGGPLPRNRACPFPELAPLAAVPGVSFYSLQLGEAPQPGVLDAFDLAPQIRDFGDSAAILANLDLLISVDTAAAHLAGGMGVPTWLLLPYSCDWRWFREPEGSPWYPRLRIFRQRRPGDWAEVAWRVRDALAGLLCCS